MLLLGGGPGVEGEPAESLASDSCGMRARNLRAPDLALDVGTEVRIHRRGSRAGWQAETLERASKLVQAKKLLMVRLAGDRGAVEVRASVVEEAVVHGEAHDRVG